MTARREDNRAICRCSPSSAPLQTAPDEPASRERPTSAIIVVSPVSTPCQADALWGHVGLLGIVANPGQAAARGRAMSDAHADLHDGDRWWRRADLQDHGNGAPLLPQSGRGSRDGGPHEPLPLVRQSDRDRRCHHGGAQPDWSTREQPAAEGGVASFEIGLDPTTTTPLITVVATGRETDVVRTVDLVMESIGEELERLQEEAGAPPSTWITARPVTAPESPQPQFGSRIHVGAIVAGLGIAATISLAFAANALEQRRTPVRLERLVDEEEPPPSPGAQPSPSPPLAMPGSEPAPSSRGARRPPKASTPAAKKPGPSSTRAPRKPVASSIPPPPKPSAPSPEAVKPSGLSDAVGE